MPLETHARPGESDAPANSALRWGATVLVLGLTAWCGVVVAWPQFANGAAHLIKVGRIGAAELLVVAGFSCLARWLLLRHTNVLRGRSALVVLGCVLLPGFAVFQSTTGGGAYTEPNPTLVRVGVLAALTLFLTHRRATAASRPPLSPVQKLLVGAAVVGAAALVGVLVGPLSSRITLRAVAVVAELLIALTLALVAVQRHRIAQRSNERWFAVGIAILSANELVNAAGMNGLLPLAGVGAGLRLAAAATIAAAAVNDLRAAYQAHRARNDELTLALADTRRQLMRLQQAHQERIHDARSALVGVIGASRIVAQAPATQAIDAHELQRMIAAELERLHELLAGALVETPRDFELTDAFAGVLSLHRLNGLNVSADDLDIAVHGCPTATATVLDNLLRNAKLHAPGAAVEIAVRHEGEFIAVDVSDNGPGIPTAEQPAVLLAGVRGSTAHAPGSGLGLHNAATAMAAQQGELHLTEAANGGLCVTLRLPVAETSVAALQKVGC